uniref:Uncharacterized protein n=1 Tax=Physcomitrium patens TaxID=3218 RepID=A0A2K1K7C0_PHYPA|nr:hypothetical protein PHYPA_011570 [Physcomitrium patens]
MPFNRGFAFACKPASDSSFPHFSSHFTLSSPPFNVTELSSLFQYTAGTFCLLAPPFTCRLFGALAPSAGLKEHLTRPLTHAQTRASVARKPRRLRPYCMHATAPYNPIPSTNYAHIHPMPPSTPASPNSPHNPTTTCTHPKHRPNTSVTPTPNISPPTVSGSAFSAHRDVAARAANAPRLALSAYIASVQHMRTTTLFACSDHAHKNHLRPTQLSPAKPERELTFNARSQPLRSVLFAADLPPSLHADGSAPNQATPPTLPFSFNRDCSSPNFCNVTCSGDNVLVSPSSDTPDARNLSSSAPPFTLLTPPSSAPPGANLPHSSHPRKPSLLGRLGFPSSDCPKHSFLDFLLSCSLALKRNFHVSSKLATSTSGLLFPLPNALLHSPPTTDIRLPGLQRRRLDADGIKRSSLRAEASSLAPDRTTHATDTHATRGGGAPCTLGRARSGDPGQTRPRALKTLMPWKRSRGQRGVGKRKRFIYNECFNIFNSFYYGSNYYQCIPTFSSSFISTIDYGWKQLSIMG